MGLGTHLGFGKIIYRRLWQIGQQLVYRADVSVAVFISIIGNYSRVDST
jgi:hypothetical protein